MMHFAYSLFFLLGLLGTCTAVNLPEFRLKGKEATARLIGTQWTRVSGSGDHNVPQ